MESAPLVSVVTPFYNTRDYLTECIESVVSQTYTRWEYILVDNQSTDGSRDIAEYYLARFPGRIRLIRTKSFLSQVQNYNFALSCIAHNSKYCKMVQADDWIYAECLERMVSLAESDSTIGIVSSFRLRGNCVFGDGLPYARAVMPGTEVCRKQLTTALFVFGSPTTTLYRSEVIREHSLFYDQNTLHEDSDACYRTLHCWNLGFVPQVLSFSRVDNDSIMTRARECGPEYLDKLLQIYKYGPIYLNEEELTVVRREFEARYYRFLAHRLLSGPRRALWKYHTIGLRTAGQQLKKSKLLWLMFLELLWLMINPGSTCARLFDRMRLRTHSVSPPSTSASLPSAGLPDYPSAATRQPSGTRTNSGA
jgi:glycosyltransferase involved in cell wall biosynthesis